MTPTAFKPQNFFGSSLCEALDRLCRAAGIVDVNWNPETKEHSDEDRTWYFIDSREFKRDSSDKDDSLTEFLNRRKTKDQIAAEAAQSERRRAFYNSMRPLFLALEEGAITANGFEKTGKRQAVQMTACDAARWGGNWTITRRADTAEVSFFIDIETEEAAATLAAVRLEAPAPVQHAGKPPKGGGAVEGTRSGDFPHSKYLSYVPDVDAIMGEEHPPSVREACRRALLPHVRKGDDLNNKAKRLHDVYKAARGKKFSPLPTGKTGKNAEIP